MLADQQRFEGFHEGVCMLWASEYAALIPFVQMMG